jgi:hypothetical protein
VENSQANTSVSSLADSKDELTFTNDRAQGLLARLEEEHEEATRKRRAGRPKGELTQSLIERLSNCNVVQLQRVKKLCDRYIKRQREPPSDLDCGERYTLHVLCSVSVKTTRFRLEFRRTSLRSKKVYVNGPYVRRYWWDGSIVKSVHVKKGKLRSSLPKKVWLTFRGLLDRPENEQIRKKLIEKLEVEADFSIR